MSPNSLDTALFFFINRDVHFQALDVIMVVATRLPYLAVIPVVIALALSEKKKVLPMLAAALLALMVTELLGIALKELFQRPRPCLDLEGVTLLVRCYDSYSMPSNHAANMFAFAVPFYFFSTSRLRHVLMAEAGLVALSRPYVGVHYPSDLLAGAMLGAAVAVVVSITYRQVFPAGGPDIQVES